jgi:stage II sporulation protein D
MRVIIALCMLALHAPMLYSEETSPSSESALAANRFPEEIRVLLEKDIEEVLLEVKGPYYIFNPQDNSRITSGLLGKRFLVRATQNGIKWGEEFPGVYQLRIVPRSKDSPLLINGIQYDGGVAIYAADNKIQVVNELPIESYVKSLLSPQFSYPLENEVMSAIAILARTDAYFLASSGSKAYWHVDAKEVGYIGSALNRPNSPFDRVVDQTKNLLLVHSTNGQNMPFPAKWTEHSAGKTASFSAIFRRDCDFSTIPVDAPHAQLDRSDAKWHFSISKASLSQKLKIPDIKNVEHFIDKLSGKTYGVRINHSAGVKDVGFFDLQRALGQELLHSNEFKTEIKGDSVSFSGYGHGHGVGLCLYSASAMAQNGENAMKILAKFFPETYLFNLSALPSLSETAWNK